MSSEAGPPTDGEGESPPLLRGDLSAFKRDLLTTLAQIGGLPEEGFEDAPNGLEVQQALASAYGGLQGLEAERNVRAYRALTDLADEGLVTKEKDPDNHPANRYSLTEAGDGVVTREMDYAQGVYEVDR